MNVAAQELYSNHGTFHEGDSGIDLFVTEEMVIPAGTTAFIKLGIKCEAVNPSPVSWLLLARSSISKTPLRLSNSIGLIDAGYRGEIMAAVDNIRSEDFRIKKGDRYFQAVSFNGGPIQMQVVSELSQTSRGEGGFGSTSFNV
jgi:dUTP pyrophosphatase